MSASRARVFWAVGGLVGGAAATWVATAAGVRAVYAFQIMALDDVATAVELLPLVLAVFCGLVLIVLIALRAYHHLTDRGFYLSSGLVVVIWLAGQALYANWSQRTARELFRYKIAIANPTAMDVLGALGPLGHGSSVGGRCVYVFPIDHTRVIRAYERLAAQGYDVSYEDPDFVEEIAERYVRPYQTEASE
ncbi:MAG TPA: hypothetical protein VM487_10325 [Phycisphaerae bacterium]|nr:hypothetical protein [Phycisphaerae bacterium]